MLAATEDPFNSARIAAMSLIVQCIEGIWLTQRFTSIYYSRINCTARLDQLGPSLQDDFVIGTLQTFLITPVWHIISSGLSTTVV